jgi:hypothetical protein
MILSSLCRVKIFKYRQGHSPFDLGYILALIKNKAKLRNRTLKASPSHKVKDVRDQND